MIALIDTNIIIDLVYRRAGFDDAVKILTLGAIEEDIDCVTASSITDIYYLIQKEVGNKGKSKQILLNLMDFLEILPVTNKEALQAAQSDWNDYEDAVQYFTALNNRVDVIITNNTKDFKKSAIPIYTPSEYIEENQATFDNFISQNSESKLLEIENKIQSIGLRLS